MGAANEETYELEDFLGLDEIYEAAFIGEADADATQLLVRAVLALDHELRTRLPSGRYDDIVAAVKETLG